MLKQQVFEIDGIYIVFENSNDVAKISINNGRTPVDDATNQIRVPLPQFRKLMDILSKTKFMFSSDNK